MEDDEKPETSLPVLVHEPNPWSSIPADDDDDSGAPDTSLLPSYVPPDESNEHNVQTDTKNAEFSKTSPDPSVLKEFDPLVGYSSLNETWATVESHPPLQVSTKTTESSHQETTPPSEPTKPSRVSLPPVQTAPTFIASIPSSLATFAKNLAISPKRSITPPLPPPPRSSSLRHSHHSSLPVNILSSADSETSLLPKPLQEATQPVKTFDEQDNNQPKSDSTFDFQKFLDQMKSRGADPIAKYLRRYKLHYPMLGCNLQVFFPWSFLSNFAKKTYTVKEQIKVINDFLNVPMIIIYFLAQDYWFIFQFIADKMRTLEGSPWQHATQQESEHALDAMEKLVMNRLYELYGRFNLRISFLESWVYNSTFQPLLPPTSRTTDDIERDHVLRQRIMLFGWLMPEHLDIPFKDPKKAEEEIKGFLEFAQQGSFAVLVH